MAIKVTGTTVINDSRNIENITTINGTAWATVVANASAGSEVTVNELTDVTLGTLSTGEVLQYNGSAWVNTGLDFTDIASTLADAQVVESNVTQHEAALTITESQISDLGTYETADSTILKDADIGVTVQPFGAYEPQDATILKDADIGINVQAYNANLVSDATYVKTDENFTTADHAKLDGIEVGATADQTKADVEGLGIAFSSISATPTTVAGYGITDAYTGAFGDLTGTPTTVSGYGITDTYTTTEADAAIATAVGNLVDSAPTALDTLNELAASLGDDADFAGSVTTNLASKLDLAGGALTGAVTTTSTIAGRDVATDGTKLDGIEALADVTDTANVTAAGALMDSEVTNLDQVKAFDSADYATAAQGALAASALQSYTVTEGDVTGHQAALSITESQISDLGTYETADATILKDADIGVNVEAYDATILKDADIGVNVQGYDANLVSDATYVKTANDFTDTLLTRLNNIEAGADVTDTLNVTQAGALMDSEVTNLADVKAFDPTDYATAAQGTLADSALQSYTVTESDVTGHEAALTITESQISDLNANYVVDATYVKTDENFTTADHTKLDTIEDSATADQTGAEIKALYEAETNAYTDALNTKLAGIETGATADQTKADIEGLGIELPAANLTGTIAAARLDTATTQAETDDSTKIATTAFVTDKIETLIGGAPGTLNDLNELAAAINDDANYNTTLTTALGTKLPKAGGTMSGDIDMGGNKVLFNNMYATEGDLPSATTYHGMFAHVHGTGAGYFAHSGSWVKLANDSQISDENFTTADHTKLDGIETSATADQTGAEIKALYEAEANAYTDALNTKLGGIETGATADQTDAEIRAAVEAATDSNVFTDADHTKLNGIAANATNVTNNNQISNGAGYITSFTNTTYSAGGGIDLSGTTFSIQSDLRDNVHYVGRDGNDYMYIGTTSMDFVLDGNVDMRLENDGDLHVDGNVVAYSTTTSDERLKKDIVKIDNALDKVSQLNGYTFEYLNDGKKSAGILAQEVEAVMPSAVSEMKLPLKSDDDQEYKVVQYDQLHGLLIEAIKELKAEIEVLKGN